MGTYYYIKSKLGNVIDIQGASTKAGAGLDAYTQKATGADNQLWEFVSDPAGSGSYFIKSKLNGNVIDIEGASTKAGTLLDAYTQKATGTDNQLWEFISDPAGSGYCFIVSKLNGNVIDVQGASTTAGALLDAYPMKVAEYDNQLWTVVGGAFPALVKTEPAPGSGLGSNSNYYLYGGVKSGGGYIALQDVVVTIDVTEDIVGTPPFNFQLNAYSPHADLDGWQQYGISMAPGSNQLNSFAENWPLSGNNLFNIEPAGFVTIPNDTTIPAGFKIVIQLSYASDGSGNIDGSLVTVYNAAGTKLGSQQISLIGQPLAAGGKISKADLAPIVAYQLNLVCWANSGVTALTSGAGTITYSSSTQMTAQNAEPPDAESNYITAETANSLYSVLPSAASKAFIQSFGVSSGKLPINAQGKLRHSRTSRFQGGQAEQAKA